MKQLVKVEEIENEGLVAMMGKRATFFCGIYIYTGEVVGVNETFVKLRDAYIVYETGEFSTTTWKDAQRLPNDWYVMIQSIETFGILK